MLFNSYVYLFSFLPLAVGVFYLLGRVHKTAALGWLLVASLVFYGWWEPKNVLLLLGSTGVNFAVGSLLVTRAAWAPGRRRGLLTLGLVFNLGLLGFFKYANFFADSLAAVTGGALWHHRLALPLAISFFTFIQIAYIVDAYRGRVVRYGLGEYATFVVYFPHLIAGPIVHHHELIEQFRRPGPIRFAWENLGVGGVILVFGLFKKVVLADQVALLANPVFADAGRGVPLTMAEAWVGALAFTCQIYFDFSGYSDMAVGASRMFGIWLPMNFRAPYQARNIIDFWRRWHITLSRFLRDYLYISLGGNRKGRARRYVNLMLTMVLGGLWHGAGWTFVVWGGLHGAYLVVNHGLKDLLARPGVPLPGLRAWGAGWLTFVAVVVAWVFFRADSFGAAAVMVKGMFGFHGVDLPMVFQAVPLPGGSWVRCSGAFVNLQGLWPGDSPVMLGFLALLVVGLRMMPDTERVLAAFRPALYYREEGAHRGPQFHPTMGWAVVVCLMFAFSVLQMARNISEFLYFQF